jgi:Carboxypeptidase regulatory-like domain
MANVQTIVSKGIRALGIAGITAALALSLNVGTSSAASAPSPRTAPVASIVTPLATGFIVVRVIDVAGPQDKPIAGATVLVTDEAGNVVAKGLTDGVGGVKFEVLEGTYKVRVFAPGYKESAQVVRVTSSEPTNVLINPERAPSDS